MNNSVQNEKASVAMIEKRARELQGKIDMMSLVEQVPLEVIEAICGHDINTSIRILQRACD